MLKRDMRPENWYVTFLGAVLMVLGYWLVSPITRDYETPKAFFAILTLNIGLLTVILGLAINFTWLEQILGKKSKNPSEGQNSAPAPAPPAPLQSKAAPSVPSAPAPQSARGKSRKQKRG